MNDPKPIEEKFFSIWSHQNLSSGLVEWSCAVVITTTTLHISEVRKQNFQQNWQMFYFCTPWKCFLTISGGTKMENWFQMG